MPALRLKVIEGAADKSSGIQVAKLAGLPRAVITRARDILESLESGHTAALGLPDQMQLFAPAPRERTPLSPNPYADGSFWDLVLFRAEHALAFRAETIVILPLSIVATIPLAVRVARGLTASYEQPYGLMPTMAVNIDVMMPSESVIAKPLIGPVPNANRTIPAMRVVMFASAIDENAFS